jgi:hypothetical protein
MGQVLHSASSAPGGMAPWPQFIRRSPQPGVGHAFVGFFLRWLPQPGMGYAQRTFRLKKVA